MPLDPKSKLALLAAQNPEIAALIKQSPLAESTLSGAEAVGNFWSDPQLKIGEANMMMRRSGPPKENASPIGPVEVTNRSGPPPANVTTEPISRTTNVTTDPVDVEVMPNIPEAAEKYQDSGIYEKSLPNFPKKSAEESSQIQNAAFEMLLKRLKERKP